MPVSPEYLDYLIDQLKVFGPVTAKRMFGGAGLYHQGVFFGLVADDVLYFKVDERNRADYEAGGSGPFRPFGSYAMGYFEVPADVLEDPDELAIWSRKAFEANGKKIKKKANAKTGRKAGKKRKRKG
jgi:DNA transformation protein and related proteins